ncbi:MAG TPA: hypothetical protein ACHBY5_13740 [Arsenophonus apicola]
MRNVGLWVFITRATFGRRFSPPYLCREWGTTRFPVVEKRQDSLVERGKEKEKKGKKKRAKFAA